MLIVNADESLVRQFLSGAGGSLKTFRYFNTRDVSIIRNHLCTIVGTSTGIPIAYGHLDPEGDDTWLGICIAEKYTGSGLGKVIMSALIYNAACLRLKSIRLSVDEDNVAAIELYKQFGFVFDGRHHDGVSLYRLELTDVRHSWKSNR